MKKTTRFTVMIFDYGVMKYLSSSAFMAEIMVSYRTDFRAELLAKATVYFRRQQSLCALQAVLFSRKPYVC